MNALTTTFGAFLIAGLLAGGGGKIKWGKDHDRALAEAKAAGKPLVLYFTTDW